MPQRRKRSKARPKVAPKTLLEPTAEELVTRAQSALTGMVCSECGWIYIQGGGSGRKTCTKCRAEALRKYDGASIDELADRLIEAEVGHDDPIGNDVFVRSRFAQAFERFNQRKNTWATATEIAREIAGGEPTRALVAKVYRDWNSKSPAERERKRRRQERERDTKKRVRRSSKRRPTLDELEAERREVERTRASKLKKGTTRKKLR